MGFVFGAISVVVVGAQFLIRVEDKTVRVFFARRGEGDHRGKEDLTKNHTKTKKENKKGDGVEGSEGKLANYYF